MGPLITHLDQVGSQEQAPGGVLHPPAQLRYVLQDQLGRGLPGTDVARPHGAQKVPGHAGVAA